MLIIVLTGIYWALRCCQRPCSIPCVTGLLPTIISERCYCYSHLQRFIKAKKHTSPMVLATATYCWKERLNLVLMRVGRGGGNERCSIQENYYMFDLPKEGYPVYSLTCKTILYVTWHWKRKFYGIFTQISN